MKKCSAVEPPQPTFQTRPQRSLQTEVGLSVLAAYMKRIEEKDYEGMYSMLEPLSAENIGKEGFIDRNSKIYKGIQIQNIKLEISEAARKEKNHKYVSYHIAFDTVAGEISFDYEADFLKGKEGYQLVWSDRMIFPDLEQDDKVMVSTQQAERGEILDRNGRKLAGKGVASSVGIVPGKFTGEDSLSVLSQLLELDVDKIQKKLEAKWIKQDSFVPIQTIPKVEELDLLKAEPEEEVQRELERQEQLLALPGVMILGQENLEQSLMQLGFQQELPFEIQMAKSQFSNADHIKTEIQLADSGYGQGEILMNPLHLASLYTGFLNDGNIIKPYLRYEDGKESEIWIPKAFSKEVTDRVLEGMKKVVNAPHGTGYAAHREDMVLAGKTGTAEIKASKDDTFGTELGWFSVFTTNADLNKPILIITMAEDVKEIGGSGYVVKKDKIVLDAYLLEHGGMFE